MKTQYRHPHGILNSLQHIAKNPGIFECLLDVAEDFDICMIRRNPFLTQVGKLFNYN